MKLNAAIRLLAADSQKSILKSLALTKVKPETAGKLVYIIVDGDPKSVMKQVQAKGWVVGPRPNSHSASMTNSTHPSFKLIFEFAEDLDPDEAEEWGLDPDSPATLVSVVQL